MDKIIESGYWHQISFEFREMCLSQMHVNSSRFNNTYSVIRYLKEHMYDCDYKIFGFSVEDVIRHIDVGVETCLFPVESHIRDWIRFNDEIEMILSRSEELLQRIAPKDYSDGFINPEDDNVDYARLSQKLNVYFTVLYFFREDWFSSQKRLNALLRNTEQNVSQMLTLDEAERYAKEDDWAEYHYLGIDKWQPLKWLGREYLPSGIARRYYVHIWEKYVIFLFTIKRSMLMKTAWQHVYAQAEIQLRESCESILEEIDDYVNDSDNISYSAELYERMIRDSEEREFLIAEESYRIALKEPAKNRIYLKKYRSFTQKLRDLMDDNPELPVVPVVPHLRKNIQNNDYDCAIAYIHDPASGDFMEKIIAITN